MDQVGSKTSQSQFGPHNYLMPLRVSADSSQLPHFPMSREEQGHQWLESFLVWSHHSVPQMLVFTWGSGAWGCLVHAPPTASRISSYISGCPCRSAYHHSSLFILFSTLTAY
jgi:hypothetical protein